MRVAPRVAMVRNCMGCPHRYVSDSGDRCYRTSGGADVFRRLRQDLAIPAWCPLPELAGPRTGLAWDRKVVEVLVVAASKRGRGKRDA